MFGERERVDYFGWGGVCGVCWPGNIKAGQQAPQENNFVLAESKILFFLSCNFFFLKEKLL